jgi:3-oxoacyl-[acyl-carrier protein] reductase
MTGAETICRWAVVSGGNGAIGRQLSEHFAAHGWRVLALDREAGSDRDGIVSRTVDVADAAAVDRALAEAIPRHEPIRLLVNAVGLIWNEPVVSLQGAAFQPHRLDTWRAVLDANLTAPFVAASAVVVRMARSGGGAIVNFSSIAARGNAGQSAYSAAKAGIEGLTRAMAAELAPLRIRVNAVAPGFIDVPSTLAALDRDKVSAIVRRTPVTRLGTVADVIAAVEFLEQQPFVTGLVLDVNGGLRL